MINAIVERIRQKRRTVGYPAKGFENPPLPDRFRGRPAVDRARCIAGCSACAGACPTAAIGGAMQGLTVDLGLCLFCGDCVRACPSGAIALTGEHRLGTRCREDLLLGPGGYRLAEALDSRSRRLFGRSLKLRQVSAGGCNACEADLNVLSTVVFDLGRFGIEFTASPRHADGLLITGPVTFNMQEALIKCWDAVPEPRIVIASGACAISGGPFAGLPESTGGATTHLPVDLFVPGCPPHPYTFLDAVLRLLGRL
jgi:Ni,Fe-hydrogenase III small subunit/formate hydrogenlyase subunit 6/NADH:ubiquinone oxidoreductase subunit I